MKNDLHSLLERTPDRRDLLRGAGGIAFGGLAASALPKVASAAVPLSAAPRSPLLPMSPACVLQSMCNFTPTATQGPFYLNLNTIKQDITDGKPGLATYVILQVLKASNCAPLQGAAVDLWHCDALGKYSGFASEGTAGQTFLRGTQISDAGGLVIFKTIYPGWYPGRTCHFHVKVHPTATSEFSTQLYYPQNVSDFIYANIVPYTTHGPATTKNNTDGIFTPATVQKWIVAPDGSGGIWSGLILGVNGV